MKKSLGSRSFASQIIMNAGTGNTNKNRFFKRTPSKKPVFKLKNVLLKKNKPRIQDLLMLEKPIPVNKITFKQIAL